MNRLLVTFYFTFCITVLFAQNCYKTSRNKGINAFNEGKYTEAVNHFKRANMCVDKPGNNDLRNWIKKSNDSINNQSPDVTIMETATIPDTVKTPDVVKTPDTAKTPDAAKTSTNTAKTSNTAKASSVAKTPNTVTTQDNAKIPEVVNSDPPAEPEPPKITDLEMVLVEGGTFTMGCTPEQGGDCYNSENPPHPVRLSSFYICKYEVTQALWDTVMGNNPSLHRGENMPVENVSWDSIQVFIRKLNELTGKKYRLPTEAEWEYAARGGKKSSGFKHSGSNNIDEVAWNSDNSGSKPRPVGGKQPNELGIYDMNGNVSEWCQDWFNFAYYKRCKNEGTVLNPKGPETGTTRVIRGGSWYNYPWNCRITDRSDSAPSTNDGRVGFRLVYSAK